MSEQKLIGLTTHVLENLMFVGEKIDLITGEVPGMPEEIRKGWVAKIKRDGARAAKHLGVLYETDQHLKG
jgi:hypothetical protein